MYKTKDKERKERMRTRLLLYMNRAEPRLDSSPIDLRLQESAHTAEVAETGLLRLD